MLKSFAKNNFRNFFNIQRCLTNTAISHPISESDFGAARGFDDIPRMKRWEVIQSFMPNGKYHGLGLNEMHKKMHEEYGDIVIVPAMFGKPEIIFSYGSKDFQNLLKSDSAMPFRYSFESLKYFREKFRPDIYGSEYGSIASENGEKWYQLRSVVNPILLPPKTVHHYTEAIHQIAKDFIQYAITHNEDNMITTRDVNLWSLESISYISLEKRLGLLSDDNKNVDAEKLVNLVRRFFTLCADFEVQPSIWKIYETKAFREFKDVNNEMLRIVMKYIEDSIEETKNKADNSENSNGILQQLLKIDKKVAIIMTVDALTAGIDTTASAAIGILYCLAKNQEKQEKLRTELRKSLPNLNESFTYKSFQNMPYLRACIKEGLRLFPPVSGTSRRLDTDFILSNHLIPKGSYVIPWPQLSYRSEDIFPRAAEYIPERWLKMKDEVNELNQSIFNFLPFGHGTRSCIGRRLANLELEVLIINLLRDFNVEWVGEDIKILSTFVNVPVGDGKLKIRRI